jgi:hypothetical protein
MRQHALDGEMGLAGVGGTEHGGDAGAASPRPSGRLRGERNCHYASELTASRPAASLLYHNATADEANRTCD